MRLPAHFISIMDTARETILVRMVRKLSVCIINNVLARAENMREQVADAIGRPATVEGEIEPVEEAEEEEVEKAEEEEAEEGEINELEVLSGPTIAIASEAVEVAPLIPRPRLPFGALNEESEEESEEEIEEEIGEEIEDEIGAEVEEEFVASSSMVDPSRRRMWVDQVCEAVNDVNEFADDFRPGEENCSLFGCDRLGCKRARCPSPVPHLYCFECFFKHVLNSGENCPHCRGQLSKKMRV